MRQELILYPALVSMALTFTVGFALVRLRALAVGRGELPLHYFLLNRGGRPPRYLVQVEQNYTNQLELPTLFYALVLMMYVTGSVDVVQLSLAWAFAATRLAHAAIHVTVNRLFWRMRAFLGGGLVLIGSFLYFLFQLSAGLP